MKVTEELLDIKSLKNQTRGTDLFSSVCAALDDMKLPWNKISGIITDGAPSMTGERSGLAILISNKVSEEGGKAVKLHCIIHQQVLCAKHLRYEHIMEPVIKANKLYPLQSTMPPSVPTVSKRDPCGIWRCCLSH